MKFPIINSPGEALDFAFHPSEKTDHLVVLGHGVTGNKDRPLLIAVAEGLSARGWPCLRISYSGNGASQGIFEESTITKEIADLQSVFDAIPETTRIAYCGHSMGGAVGVLTAVRDERIRVLITLAGMVFTKDFCQREFGEVTPGQGCMWDDETCPLSQAYVDDLHAHGSTLDAAAAMEVPWLLVHGTADDVVFPADSEAAYAAAPEPKKLVMIEGAGHSFDETSYPRVIEEIDAWLRKYLAI
jgi:pimeloyl-ACP methyl ester carboxylesterase